VYLKRNADPLSVQFDDSVFIPNNSLAPKIVESLESNTVTVCPISNVADAKSVEVALVDDSTQLR
jgi:hypothetical protein